MNQRMHEILSKRARLLERAEQDRARVAQALGAWERPLDLVDRCLYAVRFVLARPQLIAGAAFVLALLRPRAAFAWARRGWALWQGYRWVTRKLST